MTIKILDITPREKLREARRTVADIESKLSKAGKTPVDLEPYLRNTVGKLIAMEMADASLIPSHIECLYKYNKKHPIPIICCPDGGAAIAEGLRNGLEWYCGKRHSVQSRIFSKEALNNDRKEIAPDAAIDMAIKSGILIIADSAIDSGRTVRDVITSLQEKLNEKYPEHDKPIKVVVAANVMYIPKKNPIADIENPKPEMAKAFTDLQATTLSASPKLEIEVYTTDICHKALDVQNRGDFFATKFLHLFTDMLLHHVVKRQIKSAQHPTTHPFV